MLKSRKDLKSFLCEDSKYYMNSGFTLKSLLRYKLYSVPINDNSKIWKYVKTLRFAEYHINNSGPVHAILRFFYLFKLRRISYKLGYQIPLNVFGPGLCIYHWGAIIVNRNTNVGSNCTIYPGVLIGWKKKEDGSCATIGNNVFIGSGTKIIGNVHIGDNVTIGQNCVITKDIPAGSVVVAKENYTYIHRIN